MIKQLHPGDTQISAAGWNEMRAAVQGLTPGQQQYQSGQRCAAYVTIKNNTGGDLPAFSVVKIDGAMYSRSGDTFINHAAQNGVELNGITPAAATDTIAITQAACKSGDIIKAMVSGATAVMAIRPANRPDDIQVYKYAKPIAGETSCVELSPIPTNIHVLWHGADGASTSTPATAFVTIDYADDRERFLILCTTSNGLAAKAKTGAIFRYNGRLVVCQEDIPDGFTGYYYMPYYTPESNIGAAPNVTTASGETFNHHCGVASGEYQFSNKRLDYTYSAGAYSFTPEFTYRGAAVNHNGGVGIVIEGNTYNVTFPAIYNSAGASLTAYPDVYAGDVITVRVTDYNGTITVTAIEYPTDFEKGSSIVVEGTMLLGRGWDEDYITGSDFKYAIKIQGAALI